MDFEGEAQADDANDHHLGEFRVLMGVYFLGVARVPLVLLHSIAALLQGYETLLRAWMLAIAEKFPDTSLRNIRSKCPSLLPPWLLQGFETYQDVLVLRPGGIFARRLGAYEHCKVRSKSLSILAATSKCRFREGFTSEGMLCNNPPIPLRVLDFLQHPEDLLNLALVCKSTHRAGHVLLHREFPGGLGSGLLTEDDLVEAIKRRKRSMLESALHQPHHPITNSMAPTSTTMAAGPEPEACAGAVTEPEACTVDDAEEAQHAYHTWFTIMEEPGRSWDVLHCCMLTLLYAKRSHAADPSVLELPHPSLEWLLHEGGVADEWRAALEDRVRDGIVMDTEAVRRAVSHWAELNIKDPDHSSGEAARDAEHVMRVLRAAERHGQGVIVHPGCRAARPGGDCAPWMSSM